MAVRAYEGTGGPLPSSNASLSDFLQEDSRLGPWSVNVSDTTLNLNKLNQFLQSLKMYYVLLMNIKTQSLGI